MSSWDHYWRVALGMEFPHAEAVVPGFCRIPLDGLYFPLKGFYLVTPNTFQPQGGPEDQSRLTPSSSETIVRAVIMEDIVSCFILYVFFKNHLFFQVDFLNSAGSSMAL